MQNEGQSPPINLHRACEACRRKKTKCDMTPPICSLCRRSGVECIFPTSRKRPRTVEKHDRGKDNERRHIDSGRGNVTTSSVSPRPQADAHTAFTESNDILPFVAVSEQSLPSAPESTPPPARNAATQVVPIANPLVPAVPMNALDETRPYSSYHNTDQWPVDNTSFMSTGYDLDVLFGGWFDMQGGTVDGGVNGDPTYGYLNMNGVGQEHEAEEPQNGRPTRIGFFIEGKHNNSHTDDGVLLKVTEEHLCLLVGVYFEKVHGFIPIINQPKFLKERLPYFLHKIKYSQPVHCDDALILYGMLALAARFCNAPIFKNVLRQRRGIFFAREAGLLVLRFFLNSDVDTASLTYLQGLLMGAYYWLAGPAGPDGKAWFLTGMCCRVAHLLNLDTIDDDILESGQPLSSAAEWGRREELRRVWWSVVEADNFASFVSSRPTTIGQRRMQVLLPSSDELWFSETPRPSAFLDCTFSTTWKELKRCGNYHAYAWYLCANEFMMVAHKLSLQSRVPPQKLQDLEDAILCFEMALPEEFALGSGNIAFEDGKENQDNWIIALHLVLQSARACLIYRTHGDLKGLDISSQESRDSNETMNDDLPKKYRPVLSVVSRAIRAWSPEYIALCSPFTVCLLVGPYASNLEAAMALPDPQRSLLGQEYLQGAITRFAEYWDLGSAILELYRILQRQDSRQSTLNHSLKRRFPALIPNAK